MFKAIDADFVENTNWPSSAGNINTVSKGILEISGHFFLCARTLQYLLTNDAIQLPATGMWEDSLQTNSRDDIGATDKVYVIGGVLKQSNSSPFFLTFLYQSPVTIAQTSDIYLCGVLTGNDQLTSGKRQERA
ncbi:hypothetical protein TWF970_005157 [Orbilia oligospora]|uniref:Uncharacterized protein n=1 Tax=Orbilia oligospora TaxID=2813651 RepID=A0A7C8VDX4_ORBOL|nr:hypothetical protein TWF970_005157 [Orbilia oligospora]